MTPRTLGNDQPHADRAKSQPGQALQDQVGSPLLVTNPALEELGSDLYNNIQLTDIELTFAPKPNLDIAHLGWPNPRLLWAVDRFGDDVRQELGEATQGLLVESAVVGRLR